ncbi:hypothetical protein MNEG_15497, partial [Monoraphidium neglectum]
VAADRRLPPAAVAAAAPASDGGAASASAAAGDPSTSLGTSPSASASAAAASAAASGGSSSDAARAAPAAPPPPRSPGAVGQTGAGAERGAGRDPWRSVQSAISSMQRQILDRRLAPPPLQQQQQQRGGDASSPLPGASAGAAAARRGPLPVAGAYAFDFDLGIAALQALPDAHHLPPAGGATPTENEHHLQRLPGPGGPRAAPAAPGAAQLGPPQALQLLDLIGRGTFSSVYKAVWRGRYVAVK